MTYHIILSLRVKHSPCWLFPPFVLLIPSIPNLTEHANEFVSLNLFATALQSLDMSYTGLTASKAGSLLHNLLQNHNLSQPIDLNLSGNPDLSLNLRAITSELVPFQPLWFTSLALIYCNEDKESQQPCASFTGQLQFARQGPSGTVRHPDK